ncbi:DNA/RNA non-specific endonuclease [Methylocystis sp. WRRC1]|uniref:DNA/RNA non-specific endonuclease n=1 Tax=Methylocystis sp. WRRC1 TaxID=1732014 RepID=UPI001D14C49C|nr:DNA/RNA non-specific endonuclease [Methylocystis sp. WRRC1]MCC3244803.1 DNA/RNA non-specific endonuclease [Methylocystis sp. WRRC1]
MTNSIDFSYRPRLQELRRLGGDESADSAIAEFNLESAFGLERAGAPKVSPPERFAGMTGYRTDFIEGFEVAPPAPKGQRASDVLLVDHAQDGRLDYLHFSVVMSKSRRMAMFVGVNIDGAAAKSIERGRDKWFLDGRIPLDAQIGEELYLDNLLDRGHLVRREDPNWGSTQEAEAANDMTFHFTNCSPQMGAFNQRTWLGLEDYVLKNARAWKERISVFTGPVFHADDLDYRGVMIPRAYWKVIAFLSDDLKPSATAYMVSQERELSDLEAAFGAYKTYQLSVRQIETITGLSFGELANFDGFSNEEEMTRTEISSLLRAPGDMRV